MMKENTINYSSRRFSKSSLSMNKIIVHKYLISKKITKLVLKLNP